MVEIKVETLQPKQKTLIKGSVGAAGLDLTATRGMVIPAYSTARIPLGIKAEIPKGYAGFIYARSGLACKHGIRPANCVGVIDSDYRGEWIAVLMNDSGELYAVMPGERVAQVIFQKIPDVEIKYVDSVEDTDRGEGGFGSTGK